jgi:Flp pilus assembly secretin CpaC
MVKLKYLSVLCTSILLILMVSTSVGAAEPIADADIEKGVYSLLPAEQNLFILAGTSRVIAISGVQRVQIANPGVADVAVASAQDIIINGITPGITTLHAWSKDKLFSYNIHVVSDINNAVRCMKAILNDPDVTITSYKDNMLILTGSVASFERKERAALLAQAFTTKVVDLLVVTKVDVAPDSGDLASSISQIINEPNVQVRVVGQTIFLEGEVANQLAMRRAESIAMALAPDVVNLLQVSHVQIIKGTTVTTE